MAESTLTYSLPDIQKAVGHHLGYTRSDWSAEQRADIDECIRAGEHTFYHPPAAEGESPYVWSFLRPKLTIDLANGTAAYDLPDNFSRMHDGFTYAASVDLPMVTVVDEQTIRNLQARDPQAADPVYAAILQKTFDGSVGQRWQVVFYPTPDTIRTVSYRPEVHPDAMTSSAPYPMGGSAHSATLLEACLAAAEQYKDDRPGTHSARFERLLASSIEYDRGLQRTDSKAFQVRTDADTLIVSIFNIYEVIGMRAGWGAAYDAWTYDQKRQAKFLIDAGLRMFYSPPPLEKNGKAHRWSFLRPGSELSVTAGTEDYDLPVDFGGLASELTYSGYDSLYRRVNIIAACDLEMLRNGPGALSSGDPFYGAIRPKSSDQTGEQRSELLLYPNPQSDLTLVYHYHKLMLPLTETRLYPYGSREHGNTILLAILAQMDIHGPVPDPKRQKMQEFMEALAASVALDRQADAQILGSHRHDSPSEYVSVDPYRVTSVTYTGS